MRGMRDKFWQIALFLISVSVMATGVFFYVKKEDSAMDEDTIEVAHNTPGIPASPVNQASIGEVDDDDDDQDDPAPVRTAAPRVVGAVLPVPLHGTPSSSRMPEKMTEISHLHHRNPVRALEDAESRRLAAIHRVHESTPLGGEQPVELAPEPIMAPTPVAEVRPCKYLEYAAHGVPSEKVVEGEWREMIDTFHDAKTGLLDWLKERKIYMDEKTFNFMEARVRNARLLRPPYTDQPDLNWRGIGTLGKGPDGDPLVRIGSGFMTLFRKQPEQVRLELSRLLAQGWAPCEMVGAGIESPWHPLLKCLELDDSRACAVPGLDEAGWAVSTIVATTVSQLSCKLPALDQKGGCLLK